MKKLIRATALLLAATMTLTACNGASPEQLSELQSAMGVSSKNNGGNAADVPRNDTLYENAQITEVVDKPYSAAGVSGVYSGDWKGDRPEGEGTLWLNDDEFLYGTGWKNGFLGGQCEVKFTSADGQYKQYEGICAYDQPSGQGTFTIGKEGDEFRTIIEGDFSDGSRLIYYTIDKDGRLSDIGGYINGDYESYIENPNVRGGSYLIDRAAVGATYKSRDGFYIGQVNEKGQPDGYGYYYEVYELEPGYIKQLTSCTYSAYGSWKNGKLKGKFSDVLLGKGTVTEIKKDFWGRNVEHNYSVINSTKRKGEISGDTLVGNNTIATTVESDPARPLEDGSVTTTINYDTNIKSIDKGMPDGTQTHQWVHLVNDNYADDGEFFKYDENGRMVIYRTLKDNKWRDVQNIEFEEKTARDRMMTKGIQVAMIGLTIWGVYALNRSLAKDIADPSSPANKFVSENTGYWARMAEKDGHYNDAKDLYYEAKNYETCRF